MIGARRTKKDAATIADQMVAEERQLRDRLQKACEKSDEALVAFRQASYQEIACRMALDRYLDKRK